MTTAEEKLAQILTQKNILTEKEVKTLVSEAKKTGQSFEQMLIENNSLDETKRGQVISAIHEWQFANLHRENGAAETANGASGSGTLNNVESGIWNQFQTLIELHTKEATFGQAKDSAIVKIVDLIISHAYEHSASDIHIEPERGYTAVRFRIDGVMHDIITLPDNIYDPIVTRVKILAKLRTDEHQIPQDGKLQYQTTSRLIDIRVSTVPTIKGECVVMRLLSDKAQIFTLENLGLSPADYKKVLVQVKKPWGMVLVTGPTGSGKTTTLYAILQLLNRRELSIVTIEDPVEYNIEGLTQIQVNPKVNLTFATGLRSIVRQDPNIIMVGEIRDEETADIAINAAMTGHLVLSTMHTNDAPTTLPRFLEMGVKPFLIASTVNVSIAQRLVRKICTRCTTMYEMTKEDIERTPLDGLVIKFLPQTSNNITLYKGKGCEQCNGTGYSGRIGIFEVMEMTESIRQLIIRHGDSSSIKTRAIEEGMTTMLDDAITKMLAGVTTLEEVIRVNKQ